jgi:hypothetical protein
MAEMSKRRFLIVKGAAGLGNRLVSLANAIDYARRSNRVLHVDWSDGQFAAKGDNAFPLFFSLRNVEQFTNPAELPNSARSCAYPRAWGMVPEKSVSDLYRRAEGEFANRTFLRRILRRCFPRGPLRKLQRHWYPYNGQTMPDAHTLTSGIRAVLDSNCFNVGGDLPLNLRQAWYSIATTVRRITRLY